jgi:predicted RNA binding protein YcfA (HicA-like mRNA interferase family)
MDERELLQRLRRGQLANVPFRDFVSLIEAFGFVLERISGSHHIFRHGTVAVRLNIQPYSGQAKPYQLRQFLRALERHGLRWRNDDG